MSRFGKQGISIALSALATVGAPALAEGTQLTVDQAVQEALEHNDQANAARARANAAQASANSVRGRLLAGVHVSEEFQHYSEPFQIQFGGPPAIQVRDQNTNTFVVAAQQPVLGLLHIGNDYAAASNNADAANANAKTAEDEVREGVRVGFLRYFQARAAEGIAKASEEQLNEQVSVVKSKLAAGVLTNADLLRTQVAAANARQQEIQADVQAEVSRASLLKAIGRPADDSVEFVEPTNLEKIEGPLPEERGARDSALQKRPEVVRAMSEASAAHHQSNSRLFQLLPEVDVEAAYLNLQGTKFQPTDQMYIGVKAEWNVFDWGADWYAHKAASANANAAALLEDDQRRNVELDVTQKLAVARAATNAVEVAQAAIQSAEEAYRVTDALVKAGSATTTDLLDAQSALTTARLNLTRAKYDLAIARVSLNRAIGTER